MMGEHLAEGCESCQRAVHEAEQAAALLPLALPPEVPPEAVEQRLFSRMMEPLTLPASDAETNDKAVPGADLEGVIQKAAALADTAPGQASAVGSNGVTLPRPAPEGCERRAPGWQQYAAAATIVIAVGAVSYFAGLRPPRPDRRRSATRRRCRRSGRWMPSQKSKSASVRRTPTDAS